MGHTKQATLRSFAMQHITGGATSSAHTGKGTASWGLFSHMQKEASRKAVGNRREVEQSLFQGSAQAQWEFIGVPTAATTLPSPDSCERPIFPHRNHLSEFDTREQTTFPGASSITKGRRLEVTLLNQLVVTTNVTTRTGR